MYTCTYVYLIQTRSRNGATKILRLHRYLGNCVIHFFLNMCKFVSYLNQIQNIWDDENITFGLPIWRPITLEIKTINWYIVPSQLMRRGEQKIIRISLVLFIFLVITRIRVRRIRPLITLPLALVCFFIVVAMELFGTFFLNDKLSKLNFLSSFSIFTCFNNGYKAS